MSFTLSTGNIVVANASAAIASQTDTTATVRVTASAYITDGWVYSTGVVAIITINGSTSTKTIFGNGAGYYYASDGTKTVTYDVSVSKTTAAQNISWSVQFWQYTDGVKQTQKQTNSGTVAVKAKTSYSVTYNANGGTGAPAAQTKYYGTALTLSSTKPTRTGYTFSKWNTNSSGTGTSYNAGASYTGNAALTLYAVWTANTYTITYNANGGSGAPSAQTKTYGVDLTLSSTTPTRTNYNFMGWATSSTASTAEYAAGATFKVNAATTLYAVWELAYTTPDITNYTAERATSEGALDDFGTYILVEFDWACCQLTATNNVKTITLGYRVYGTTTWSNTTVSASGTSGSVSQVIGANAISVDSVYQVQITVTDELGGTSSKIITVPMAQFILDFKKGGKGIAVGKPAALDDTFEVAKKTIFTGGSDVAVGTASTGMVLVGAPGGAHIAVDNNEIQAKANGTSAGQLNINPNGGLVSIGSGGIQSDGAISSDQGLTLANNKHVEMKNASGVARSVAFINTSNQLAFGYGGFANTEGSVVYYGNTIEIRTNDVINMTSPNAGLTRRAYGVNKSLWSGAMFMQATQTATLSEGVSAQPHGIILVWTKYENSAAADTCFVHNFVPKHFVATHPGKALLLPMATGSGFGMHGMKCVYINNTTVTGHATNDTSGTDSMTGVAYNNHFWVLKYVIGV